MNSAGRELRANQFRDVISRTSEYGPSKSSELHVTGTIAAAPGVISLRGAGPESADAADDHGIAPVPNRPTSLVVRDAKNFPILTKNEKPGVESDRVVSLLDVTATTMWIAGI